MLHESDLEQKLTVTDVDTNFESIYEKDYIPQKYIEDIKQANVLIIPNEGFRNKKGVFFPECTSDFYQFLKNTSEIKTEICIDDDEFEKLELHADIVYVATLIVQYAVFPVVTGMIASYLYDKVKSMTKKKTRQIPTCILLLKRMENQKKWIMKEV